MGVFLPLPRLIVLSNNPQLLIEQAKLLNLDVANDLMVSYVITTVCSTMYQYVYTYRVPYLVKCRARRGCS